jgi:hypothetical protein
MITIGFLHTSQVHVPTFEALLAELAPGAASTFVVDERLLTLAQASGINDPGVAAGTERALDRLAADGVDAIVCTCSTIGGVAEQIGVKRGLSVLRVDRAMAERAVELGGRIVAVAAVESTLEPTRTLLESVGAESGAAVDLELFTIPGAWDRFEAGDQHGYLKKIADALETIAERCDVIVLAQASMADAVDLVELAVPVLSSPRLAVSSLLA